MFKLDGGALSAPKFTTTGTDGKFSFSKLVPSATPYEVSEVGDETVGKNRYFTDTNKADDIAAVGKAIPDVEQGMRIDITAREFTVTSNKHFPISSGKDSTTWVNYIDGSIHGYKFEDLNANGIQDGKEGPLQGVVFDLYKFVRTDVPSSPAVSM